MIDEKEKQIGLFLELLNQRRKDLEGQLMEAENKRDSLLKFMKEARLNEIEYLINMFEIIVMGKMKNNIEGT